jgi:hypothetical protein
LFFTFEFVIIINHFLEELEYSGNAADQIPGSASDGAAEHPELLHDPMVVAASEASLTSVMTFPFS